MCHRKDIERVVIFNGKYLWFYILNFLYIWVDQFSVRKFSGFIVDGEQSRGCYYYCEKKVVMDKGCIDSDLNDCLYSNSICRLHISPNSSPKGAYIYTFDLMVVVILALDYSHRLYNAPKRMRFITERLLVRDPSDAPSFHNGVVMVSPVYSILQIRSALQYAIHDKGKQDDITSKSLTYYNRFWRIRGISF